ncbi:MAG: hypothetical protein GY795_25730 [Desulfobacterales bacterium]|nr:hypothetical protein [Desulfobacterales bacterium]
MGYRRYVSLIWPIDPKDYDLEKWFPPEPPQPPILPKPSFLRKWLQPIWPIDPEKYDLSENDDIKEDTPTVNYEDHPDWTDVYFEESGMKQDFDEDQLLAEWIFSSNIRDLQKKLGLTIFAEAPVNADYIDEAIENGYFPYDPENKIDFPDYQSDYHASYFPPEEFIKQTELFIDILKNGDPEVVKEIIETYDDLVGEEYHQDYFNVMVKSLISKLEIINNNAKIAQEKGISVMAFCYFY